MELKVFILLVTVFSCALGQTFRICVPPSKQTVCNRMERDDSQAICEITESRVECAVKLARGTADLGVFSEEEMLVLSKQSSNDLRVIGSVRDSMKLNVPYTFEAVAVVPSTHTDGLAGLRGGRYCHPGLDQADQRWSLRVLKTLETVVAETDRCGPGEYRGKTNEEIEVEKLKNFFSAACRPGRWSYNDTLDARLKLENPELCSLCSANGQESSCQYNYDMDAQITRVNKNNRHIQALECLRRNGTVAFAAWQHVQEYFNFGYHALIPSYSLLCPDGSLQQLNADNLSQGTAPCSWVKQPWAAVVTSAARAQEVLKAVQSWWPLGVPADTTWRADAFGQLTLTSSIVRIVFNSELPTPAVYTTSARNITDIDSNGVCIPNRRWCTVSEKEQAKCNWLRQSAHILGVQPGINCQQRSHVFDCLKDIQESQADLIATSSNYGYIARQHYKLTAVKLVQNAQSSASSFSRITALIRETSVNDITRFENLREKKACFPEYGGIAYMSFVRVAQELGVISKQECDYARAVGEFFQGACAPGAESTTHSLITTSSYNKTNLCTVCQPAPNVTSTYTCDYNEANFFYGNLGALRCLGSNSGDVAFVEISNIANELAELGYNANQFRALCSDNTLGATTGVSEDSQCLLAHIVNSEVLGRRDDPDGLGDALSTMLDTLDSLFDSSLAEETQLVNFKIFEIFDGERNLLFKDAAIGFSEPTVNAPNEAARNYIQLFEHLESCNAAPPHTLGFANRNLYSLFSIALMTIAAKFIFD